MGVWIIGGLISLLFIALVWHWGKVHNRLEGSSRSASYFQLISYIFFYAASIGLCGLLSSPWHTDPGFYFPEKVIEAGTLDLKFSAGMKVGLFLVLGFFFIFLNRLKIAKTEK